MGNNNKHNKQGGTKKGGNSAQVKPEAMKSKTVRLDDDLIVQIVYGVSKVDDYIKYVINNYYNPDNDTLNLVDSLNEFSEMYRKECGIKHSNTLVLPVFKHKTNRTGYKKFKKFFIKPLPTPQEACESIGNGSSDFLDGINDRWEGIDKEFNRLESQEDERLSKGEDFEDEISANKAFIKADSSKKQVESLHNSVEDLVDDLRNKVRECSQSSNSTNTKRDNEKYTKLKKTLDETQAKLTDANSKNSDLKKRNESLNATLKQHESEIISLKEQIKEFSERAVILKSDVLDALENAYDMQKDITTAENLANSLLQKCAAQDKGFFEDYVKSLSKLSKSTSKCKNYSAYKSELRNITVKGMVMKGSDLYEKMKDNIDKKETWISILNAELFRFNVGGAIVMCEDIAIRLARKYPTVNMSNNKFADLATSIREKAAKIGLKVDSAKPYESATNTEGWEALEFRKPYDGLLPGQVAEVEHLGVRYGNSQDKTTFFAVESVE